jgi:dTDP-4-amino-4,6-dideoxygalactose transaminase
MLQFIDLAKQYQQLKVEIDEGIHNVLNHGKYIMGPEVKELETKLAEYVGVKHCISCSNGTDALFMPLMAWGIGRADAVFTTTFSFMATAEVISLCGATPVFVDIDLDTYNIDPPKLEIAIQEVIKEGKFTPRVVIPVDLFGLPCDYDRILQIAKKYSLKVLEDAAQGFGGTYKGKRAGGFGNVGTTSFFPAKPLGCYGDGGAIFTNLDELAEIIKSIRVHGRGTDKYDNVRIGLNARLDTLQAAILLPKLKAFDDYELASRNDVASKYTGLLEGTIKTPFVPENIVSSWAQYAVLAKNKEEREALMERLKQASIPTMIYYHKPLHLQTAFEYLGYHKGDFPVAETVSDRIFSLPMHPYLTDKEIEIITDLLKQ